MNNSQKGIAHLMLVLVAGIGLLAFIAVSQLAQFKNNLFSDLYPKKYSHATGVGTTEPVGVGSTSPAPSPSSTPTPAPTPLPTPTPDTTPPTVTITNPQNNTTVRKNATIYINASASDASGISKVEFYVNNSLKCTDTAAPYSCSWTVPSKPRVTYTISAKAFDTLQNNSTATIQVTSM